MSDYLRALFWRCLSVVVVALGFLILLLTWPASKIAQFGSWFSEALLDYAESAARRGTTSGRWW